MLKDYRLILDDMATMFRQRDLGIDQIEWANDWDDVVTTTMGEMRDFNSHWGVYHQQGPRTAARVVLCNLDLMQARLSNQTVLPSCSGDLCQLDEDLCPPEDDFDNPPSNERGGTGNHDELRRRSLLPDEWEQDLHLLEKRSDRPTQLVCPNQTPYSRTFTITNADSTSCGSWNADNEIYERALNFVDSYDCSNPQVTTYRAVVCE